MGSASIALRMENINKSFGGIRVLKDVSFEARAGEVQALVGENGAGKSVLMKILIGAHQPDSGKYYVGQKHVHFASPMEAYRGGVAMVYQSFSLIPTMTVAENVMMGRLASNRWKVDWNKVYLDTTEYLQMIEASISPRALVSTLRVAEQQEVEIAKALSFNPLVLVLDEPSTALARAEVEHLYKLVELLRRRGQAIVYISHKLDEVFDLADRVTIIRDGDIVGNHKIDQLTPAALIENITGREISTDMMTRTIKRDESQKNVLEIRNLEAKGLFSGINLTVAHGEIVGLTGLVGSGKTEVGKAIFGALSKRHHVTGTLVFDGKELDIRTLTPVKAKKIGIGMVTEDRQREGIIPEQSVVFHVTMNALDRVVRGLYIMPNRAKDLTDAVIEMVRLHPPDPKKQLRYFSGGNQQKIVVGRWLAAQSRLLILDEPTQGVDVGAREELYEVIRKMVAQGIGVLLISSDLREILALSNRIVIMRQGRIIGETKTHETSGDDLLRVVLGEANLSDPPK